MMFSPDGKFVASGSDDHAICIWDVEMGQIAAGPFEDQDEINSIAFSPDGKRVVSGSGEIRIWDIETGQILPISFTGHRDRVYSVAFSPDGQHVASGSYNTPIRVWDIHTGQIAAGPLEGHRGSIYCIAFSPDGGRMRIASASWDGTVRIWDIGSFHLAALQTHPVALLPNGNGTTSTLTDLNRGGNSHILSSHMKNHLDKMNHSLYSEGSW